MNDPWDVKSVRQPGQYVSCMKINGVPLLPPLLSKECRDEMKYYKLLAIEIQKRISALQSYVCGVESSSSDYEESTDTLELPQCTAEIRTDSPASHDTYPSPRVSPRYDKNTSSNISTNALSKNIESPNDDSPKFYIDLNVNINNKDTSITNDVEKCTQACSSPHKDVPERDYNCYSKVTQNITEKQTITKVGTRIHVKKRVNNDSFAHKKNAMLHSFSERPVHQDGPPSISSKSFTGSLNDLYSECIRDSHIKSGKLVRQSSYTLLQPSPELLAHLEIHAQTTGVDMASISMSESLSNLSTPNKKRRSWDLESAKVKWSNMALELKQKDAVTKTTIKSTTKKITPPRSKSFAPSLMKRNNTIAKPSLKSEPLIKSMDAQSAGKNNIAERAVKSDPPSPANKNIRTPPKLMPVPTEPLEDPATRIRELYEKVQKQQLMQMASLVEKQKREQLMLQQVFEEQNHMLFKQLKTICPKSPVEAKQAWVDQNSEADRGPVSLSQVINYKSSENSPYSSPVSSTLTDTNYYINHCDNVLKKSRDITNSLKKQPIKFYTQNGVKAQSRQTELEGSKTRTHSPGPRNNSTSRRLNYDTSASTDRDYEQILTDRTNDTMADLNVTFPSDHSEEDVSIIQNKSVVSQYCNKEVKTQGYSTPTDAMLHSRSTDIAINKIERVISNSINNNLVRSSKAPIFANPPTATERAAATKIVAHVKGYLVRRLMRTERVQGIVQTIKDALLCALQLHQDREGIRGADVDLHRRLIQQITAACYSLHDTFVASNTVERCAMIAADRDKKKRALNARPLSNSFKQTDIMSQSHSGSFPARSKRQPPSLMTQSNYETFSGDKSSPVSRRYMASPRRRPWR